MKKIILSLVLIFGVFLGNIVFGEYVYISTKYFSMPEYPVYKNYIKNGDYEKNKKGNFYDYKKELLKYNLNEKKCKYISNFYKSLDGKNIYFACGVKEENNVYPNWTIYINGYKIKNVEFNGPAISGIRVDKNKNLIIDLITSHLVGTGKSFKYKFIDKILYFKELNEDGEWVLIDDGKGGFFDSRYLERVLISLNHGHKELELIFSEEGKKLFAKVTEKISKKYNSHELAIFVGGKLITHPSIRNKISDGRAVIIGSFSDEEIKELANTINYGLLKDNISQAKNILKNTKYEKYIKIIDNFFNKMSDEKIKKSLKIIEKIDLSSPKFKKYKDLFVYIKAKIEFEIYKRGIN